MNNNKSKNHTDSGDSAAQILLFSVFSGTVLTLMITARVLFAFVTVGLCFIATQEVAVMELLPVFYLWLGLGWAWLGLGKIFEG